MNQLIETTVKGKNVLTKDASGDFHEIFVLL